MIFSFYLFCYLILFAFILEILDTYYIPAPTAPLVENPFCIIAEAILLEMGLRREVRRRG
jgi:hypothetical protein